MFDSELSEFRRILSVHAGPAKLSEERRDRLVKFYGLVLEENETQNLTRLLSPRDFFEGHVLDAWEIELCGAVKSSIFDLGTGVGSPGLIHSILFGVPWTLCDSEKSKIAFLERAIQQLEIPGVTLTSQRAESYLATHKVDTVVAKAVGKVEKLFGWLKPCSTWNKLVLLKGPRWEEEWQEFQRSKFRRDLVLSKVHEYTVGEAKILRKIVILDRK